MRRLHLIFFGLLLTISLVNAQDDKSKSAQEAVDKKDYKTAFSVTKEILDGGNASEALKFFIQLREAGMNDVAIFEALGDTYAKMKVFELAIENYEEAEKIDSSNVTLKFKNAELLYKQKRYTDAVNKYLKVIAIDPKNSKAYAEAAQIFYLAERYADAALMFEKYLAIEQTKEAYESITESLISIKDYEKAYKFGSEGMSKYPDNSKIAKNAAIAAYALKNFEDASKFYKVIPDSELTTDDLVYAARAFQQIKADSIALIYFEKAVAKDSTKSSIYMDLANGNYLKKNYDLAVKYYEAKIKSDSTYEPAYRFMGFALMQLQRWDDTRKAFLKSVELNDTSVISHYWLGQTYRQLDSLSAAEDRYEDMLDLIGNREPQFKNYCADAYGFLAQRAFEKKNYGGAIGYLRKAVSYKPEVLAYKTMLASALHQNGNIDEAIEWYRRILKIDPKNEVAKKGLRMLSAD